MKKIFLTMVLIFIFISTLSYSALADKLKGLSPQQIESKMKELLVIGKTDDNEEILREYIDFLGSYEIPKGYDSVIEKTNDVVEKELGNEFKKLQKIGFCITYIGEGNSMIQINYKTLIERYNKYLSKDYLIYLKILSYDVAEMDAGIVISIDDLFERIITIENFLKDASDKYSAEKESLEGEKEYLKILYFLGLENTRVFERPENKIEDFNIIKSFQKNIKKYSDTSETAKLLKEYYSLLQKSRYYKTKEISKFLEKNRIGFEFRKIEE